MNSSNFFDDDKTIITDLQPPSGEEKLLFLMENDPENKLFLASGTAITVGRSIENDFFVESKTVSRKHLTLTRNGRNVTIDISGRNGLYMDNQLHTGPVITVSPPASFTIGDVPCRLEFETDEDKTIIVTPGLRPETAGPPSPPPRPAATPAASEPEPPKPFDPSPRDTFMNAPQAANDKPSPSADGTFSDNWKQEYAVPPPPPVDPPHAAPEGFGPTPRPSAPAHGDVNLSAGPPPAFEPAPRTAPGGFDPVPRSQKYSGQGTGGNKSKLIIGGIIALSVLILAFIAFILFFKDPAPSTTAVDSPAPAAEKPAQNTAGQPAPEVTETPKEDPNKALFDLANELISSGDTVAARDVLADIPKDSAYYGRAQRLLEKLPEK